MDNRTRLFVKAKGEAMAAIARVIQGYDLSPAEVTLMLVQIIAKWQDGVVRQEQKLSNPNNTDNTVEHLEEAH